MAAALTLGAAASFWVTGTQASIRPMTALFVALLLDALLELLQTRWRRADLDWAVALAEVLLDLSQTATIEASNDEPP